LPTMGTVGGVSKCNPVEMLLSGQDVVDCHVPGAMQIAPNLVPVDGGEYTDTVE
jgi:hypothetical protein